MVFEQITGMIISALDVAFAPIIAINPVLSLFIVSTVISLLILGINMLLINKNTVKKIKDSMSELREAMTKAQKLGNTEEATKLMNELMKLNSQYFKKTYKSLVVSLVIVFLFLPWVGFRYAELELGVPFVGYSVRSITIPVLGSEIQAWMVWYILVSFTIGWVLRKLLAID